MELENGRFDRHQRIDFPIRIGNKNGDRKGAPEKGKLLTKYDSHFLRFFHKQHSSKIRMYLNFN